MPSWAPRLCKGVNSPKHGFCCQGSTNALGATATIGAVQAKGNRAGDGLRFSCLVANSNQARPFVEEGLVEAVLAG